MKIYFFGFKIICFIYLLVIANTSLFAQAKKPPVDDAIPDDTYGKNGWKRILLDTIKMHNNYDYNKKIEYWNSSGFKRESITTVKNDRSDLSIDSTHETFEILKNGDTLKKRVNIHKDDLGNEIFRGEETYITKVGGIAIQKSGLIILDGDNSRPIWYNPKAGDWKPIKDSVPASFNYNRLFGGFGLIHEDAGMTQFNTYGGDIDFILGMSKGWGLKAEVDFNKGSNLGFDFTKTQVLVGANYTLNIPDPVHLDFSSLVGYGNLNTEYKPASYSQSTGFLSAKVGMDVGLMLSPKFGLVLGAAYNPSFTSGKVQNNIALDLGLAVYFTRHKLYKPELGK